MSTLWTPDGERPVRPEPGPAAAAPRPAPSAAAGSGAAHAEQGGPGEPTDEELRAHLSELREQLVQTPAAVVVANHAFGLFELAAVHLSAQPPQLEEASLAIDALGALVDGL